MISIDTLRPDHLGCYGHEAPTSPNIDALARSGTRFARVHSSTTWTLPAHLSLLTGLPDDLHGVVHDVVPLDPHRTLLAERFQQAGYATAGFFGGPYLHGLFGFARGFDSYLDCSGGTLSREGWPSPDDPGSADEKIDRIENESHRIRTAERTEQAVEQFLEEHGDEPFFLFIHHWDVHFDFNAPQEFVDLFAPEYQGRLSMREFMKNPDINPSMDEADRQYLLACYDAEIRSVDHQIGKLREKLERIGVLENTYIVITADHGEQFFEHGMKGHRIDLYEETLRIPLIITGPGVRPAQVVERQARIFDIMPTVLSLARLPPVSDAYGVSLHPLLRGEDPPGLSNLPIVAELFLSPEEDPGHYTRHLAVGRSGRKLIQATRHAFVPNEPVRLGVPGVAPPLIRLFDLKLDPGEQRELSLHAPELLEEMQILLARVEDGLATKRASLKRAGQTAVRALDPDVDRMLRENGYVKGG
ncbi:MAG: sulfatase [Planctomycetota bacterium]